MTPKRRTLLQRIGASVMACGSMSASSGSADEFVKERAQMVAEIAELARATAADTGRGQFSAAVMDAMRKVPRHRFVPPSELASAYRNRPLPIGRGQTISQPYIVALTTDLIEPQKHHRVLEIGTGSGYQAAVLAELVHQVYSIEIVESLAREAATRLRTLRYANVEVRHGDGHAGWPALAPFDGIVVTAAAARIPEPLVAQLKPGGRMVIPVGPPDRTQDFVLLEKRPDGSITKRVVLPVMFVPMTGGTS